MQLRIKQMWKKEVEGRKKNGKVWKHQKDDLAPRAVFEKLLLVSL